MPVPITFLITTKDEEVNLAYSLASVCDWAEQVFVVDSGSTDRTEEIARRFGAEFVHHEWCGYAGQKNWALDNLPIKTPWVFIIDADEVVTPELREELTRIIAEGKCNENGFYVNRHFLFLGKRIRHCGYYPSWNIRFLRLGKARYEDRDVHEHMLVEGGTGFLKGEMEHNDRRGLEFYIAKHNQYSTLEAREMFKVAIHQSHATEESFWDGPIARRRWIKQHVWPKIPFRWVVRFLYMYVWKLGFLDGYIGFHFCVFLTAYEHQIHLKLVEMLREHRVQQTQSKAI